MSNKSKNFFKGIKNTKENFSGIIDYQMMLKEEINTSVRLNQMI